MIVAAVVDLFLSTRRRRSHLMNQEDPPDGGPWPPINQKALKGTLLWYWERERQEREWERLRRAWWEEVRAEEERTATIAACWLFVPAPCDGSHHPPATDTGAPSDPFVYCPPDIGDAWDRRQLREGELLQRPAEFTNPSLGAGSSGNNAKLREDAIDMDDELVEASCDSSSV